tara:strand:- start:443 stop:610 length:168 start_codon:yes stop_codon:yes gene_type:complete
MPFMKGLSLPDDIVESAPLMAELVENGKVLNEQQYQSWSERLKLWLIVFRRKVKR